MLYFYISSLIVHKFYNQNAFKVPKVTHFLEWHISESYTGSNYWLWHQRGPIIFSGSQCNPMPPPGNVPDLICHCLCWLERFQSLQLRAVRVRIKSSEWCQKQKIFTLNKSWHHDSFFYILRLKHVVLTNIIFRLFVMLRWQTIGWACM